MRHIEEEFDTEGKSRLKLTESQADQSARRHKLNTIVVFPDDPRTVKRFSFLFGVRR